MQKNGTSTGLHQLFKQLIDKTEEENDAEKESD